MTKKLLQMLALYLVVVSCAKEEETVSTITIDPLQKNPLSASQINAKIDQSLSATNSFDWNKASNHLLWSGIYQGNKMASIGFGVSSTDFDRTKSPNNNQMQASILQIIKQYEQKDIDKILIASDAYLNQMDVLIEKQETVIALRSLGIIRYFEPADYKYFANQNTGGNQTESSSSSGCGFGSSSLSASDYTTVTPNARVPWAFYNHNIPTAWNSSTGAGITIGIIDTGTSSDQTLLGSSFNSGLSSGRTISKFGVYVDSIWPWSTSTDGPNDQCGHGTKMASAAAAPRNNAGLPVGVAYNANLITYRAASNVVLDGYHEQEGVKKAFNALANNSAVRIISMSMGHIFSVGKISDAVKYAHSKGKLIFCAGGTSTSFTNFVGVIFPAWMPETQAVTGVKEGTSNQKCSDCHSGSEIDFTVQMERPNGNKIPVLSYYNTQADYVGGSSVATATTAGIAALVWSKNPTWTREQVLAKLRQSATYFPTPNSSYGYGNINAAAAVQ